MTTILVHVVVICLATPLLKRSSALAIFGPLSLKIAFLWFANAMSARFINENYVPHPLSFTPLLPLVPLPNGALIYDM